MIVACPFENKQWSLTENMRFDKNIQLTLSMNTVPYQIMLPVRWCIVPTPKRPLWQALLSLGRNLEHDIHNEKVSFGRFDVQSTRWTNTY